MYPDPCVECGGVDQHLPIDGHLCPAVRRGAGSRRDHCGSRCPDNRAFTCARPAGHHLSPEPNRAACSTSAQVRHYGGITASGYLEWDHDKVDRADLAFHASRELKEPRDGQPCHRCGEYGQNHPRWCRHHPDWRLDQHRDAESTCTCGLEPVR